MNIFLKGNNEPKKQGNTKESTSEQGITLIALVNIIIIILILIGVTLVTVLWKNRLVDGINKANEEEETLLGTSESANSSTSPETSSSTELNTESSTNPNTGLAGKLNNQIGGGDNSVIGKTVTGLKTANLAETYKWQIFDVDEDNVYLIASDYINTEDCPKGAKNTLITGNTTYENSMDKVINDYEGSASITDPTMQSLNSKWFNLVKSNASEDSSAKAVAYMLDRDQWTTKFAGSAIGNDQIDYVIGGPTIEQLFTAYNKEHSTNYQYKAVNDTTYYTTTGYEIRENGGNWTYAISQLLDTNDSAFVISSIEKASGMWVASPSAYSTDYVMYVRYGGGVNANAYSSNNGFRPVVSLKSSVTLTESEGGYTIQ